MEKLKFDLKPIAEAFSDLTFVSSNPYGSGHINDTFLTVLKGENDVEVKFIHQRINNNVFKNPEMLMDNIVRVTNHIIAKLNARNESVNKNSLQVVMTKNGKATHIDQEGKFWRCYVFIEGASTHDVLETNAQAYEAAYAFGKFARELEDIKGERLFETIVDFHHTPKRFARLEEAIAKDSHGRVKECKNEIEFALAHKQFCSIVIDGLADGSIPERITHNDTKINNVMLDDVTGKACSVIDLDTVMPGSALYDFGDLIRTSISSAKEDEEDLSKIVAKLDRFESLIEGYLKGAEGCLTSREIELLPLSGRLITFECGTRFLTDYLEGDTYFKVHKPKHNLIRARSQFQLVLDMEKQEEQMIAITKKYL